jgi:hypothetical protein
MGDKEDFLEEDAEIAGQRVCLLSFLSPEKVLARKDLFMFEAFLQNYEYSSRTKSLEEFLVKTANGINAKLDAETDRMLAQDLSGAADICRSAKLRVDTLVDEVHAFIKQNDRELRTSKMKEAFDTFLFVNKAKLEDEFYAKNEFQTTVRGLKIRGVYGSQAEAVARSKKLQRQDTLHNIFLAEVGKWLPWDPEPNEVAEQEYAEDQLNTLMKKYKENEEAREAFQRENRARLSKGKTAVVGTANEEATDASGSAVPADINSMFSSDGPADLAIARKMAKE